MAEVELTPKRVGELIDDIERIREELLRVQNCFAEGRGC